MSIFTLGVFIGSLIMGMMIGSVTAICGVVKGKTLYGVLGFFSCVIAALVLGIILVLPVSAVFLWLIFKM